MKSFVAGLERRLRALLIVLRESAILLPSTCTLNPWFVSLALAEGTETPIANSCPS